MCTYERSGGLATCGQRRGRRIEEAGDEEEGAGRGCRQRSERRGKGRKRRRRRRWKGEEGRLAEIGEEKERGGGQRFGWGGGGVVCVSTCGARVVWPAVTCGARAGTCVLTKSTSIKPVKHSLHPASNYTFAYPSHSILFRPIGFQHLLTRCAPTTARALLPPPLPITSFLLLPSSLLRQPLPMITPPPPPPPPPSNNPLQPPPLPFPTLPLFLPLLPTSLPPPPPVCSSSSFLFSSSSSSKPTPPAASTLRPLPPLPPLVISIFMVTVRWRDRLLTFLSISNSTALLRA